MNRLTTLLGRINTRLFSALTTKTVNLVGNSPVISKNLKTPGKRSFHSIWTRPKISTLPQLIFPRFSLSGFETRKRTFSTLPDKSDNTGKEGKEEKSKKENQKIMSDDEILGAKICLASLGILPAVLMTCSIVGVSPSMIGPAHLLIYIPIIYLSVYAVIGLATIMALNPGVTLFVLLTLFLISYITVEIRDA